MLTFKYYFFLNQALNNVKVKMFKIKNVMFLYALELKPMIGFLLTSLKAENCLLISDVIGQF